MIRLQEYKMNYSLMKAPRAIKPLKINRYQNLTKK